MSYTPNRRDFIQLVSGLGLVGFLPNPVVGQEAMPARIIPGTNEMLPIIGLGSSKPVLEIPEHGIDPLIAVVKMLVESGGRVVDSSPREEAIDRAFGQVLMDPRWRQRLFVSTKINGTGRQIGIDQKEQTQRLFGKHPADLILVESMRDIETHWPNLRMWKDNGETRYIGATVSNIRDHETLERFMKSESPDIIQVNYSLGEPQAEQRILPLAHDLGIAVLVNRPFMNGAYFQQVQGRELPEWATDFDCNSWAQFTLKYTLAHPAVTCALTETTNPRHMLDNIGAAFGLLPPDNMLTKMKGYFTSLQSA